MRSLVLVLFAASNFFAASQLSVIPGVSSPQFSVYPTITAALADASDGDTIVIHNGPILKNGELSHVLWDSKPALTGSEPLRSAMLGDSAWEGIDPGEMSQSDLNRELKQHFSTVLDILVADTPQSIRVFRKN